MDRLRKITKHLDRVRSVPVQRFEGTEGLGHFGTQHQFQEIVDPSAVGEAEHCADAFDRNLPFPHRDRLVEDRQPVPHRPLRRPGDQAQRILFRGRTFLLRDVREMLDQDGHLDAAQVEPLAARENGHRHAPDFGRREYELDVLRRLLERLEERVECTLREHVDFVDDEDLVARCQWPVARAFDDLAHIVHAGVRCGVHLDHIGMVRLDDRLAVLAVVLEVDGRFVGKALFRIVERTR